MVMAVFYPQYDRPGGKKQQRFEEGVGHQVEHASRKSSHTDRSHHKSQLADGRISQHLLNVKLRHRDGGGKQRRHSSHKRYNTLRIRYQNI